METPILTQEQAWTHARDFLAAKFDSNGFSLREELTAETTGHWVIFWTGPGDPSSGNDAQACPPLLVDRQTGEVEMTLTATRPASGEAHPGGKGRPTKDVAVGEEPATSA